MNEIIDVFQSDFLGQFLNPRRRLFWGYLLSAIVIGFLWLNLVKK